MDNLLFCQSCCKPLEKKSVKGTERDGSISNDYCIDCYNKSEFTQPALTLVEMKNRIHQDLKTKNMPKNVINLTLKILPELKRWRNNNSVY